MIVLKGLAAMRSMCSSKFLEVGPGPKYQASGKKGWPFTTVRLCSSMKTVGHLVALERARPGGTETFLGLAHASRPQQAVDLRGADGAQFFLHVLGQGRVVALVVFEPFGQAALRSLLQS